MQEKLTMVYKRFYPLIVIIVIILIISTILFMESDANSRLEFHQDQPILGMIQVIFPEANYFVFLQDNVYAVYDNFKNLIGYEFLATGEGFCGDIYIQVGLEDQNTIKGLNIKLHSEVFNAGTEYGEPLDFDWFVSQFEGLKIDDCVLSMDGGAVDVITGATTSSRVVTNAVRETALEVLKLINING